jgi:hypothetical protein
LRSAVAFGRLGGLAPDPPAGHACGLALERGASLLGLAAAWFERGARASGWIGSAVVPELIGAGHEVIGLARSDASAAALTAAGAQVQRGTIDDLAILRSAAAASDGVIHLAFKHDIAFSGGFEAAADADRRAVESFGEALAGLGRPFVIASGTLMLAPGRVATERDGRDPGSAAHLSGGPHTRATTALLTLSLASRGVRSSVLRLPPTVHGDGDHGFMAALVGIARDNGVSCYIGDGSNRWPAVHRLDAAHLAGRDARPATPSETEQATRHATPRVARHGTAGWRGGSDCPVGVKVASDLATSRFGLWSLYRDLAARRLTCAAHPQTTPVMADGAARQGSGVALAGIIRTGRESDEVPGPRRSVRAEHDQPRKGGPPP